MKINKVKEIIKFDISKSIHNKWFIIFNVLSFISILIATNWSNISRLMDKYNINFIQSNDIIVQVVDNEGFFYDDFLKRYENDNSFKIEKIDENTYSKDNIPEDNIIMVDVQKDKDKVMSTKIVTKESVSTDVYDKIYSQLKMTRSKLFAEENNIDIDKLNALNDEVYIERERLGVDAENADTKEIIKMISVLAVYMVLIFVLSRIANSITQEKLSKSIEYVLTSISEKEYLLVKVLGSTLQVVIQMLYILVYYFIGNLISSLFNVNAQLDISSIGAVDTSVVGYIFAMALYVIFTVFLTTLIQAALSSRTTSVSEAGNTTAILLFPIIALYIISLSVISPYNAVSPVMYVISCMPIVSTFFVPSMIIIGQATALQIAISFILLILSVPLIFNICAKYFKNGILDYTVTNKNILKNNKKELTLKEKQEIDFKKNKAKNFAFTIGFAMIIFIVMEVISSYIFEICLQNVLRNVQEATVLVINNSLVLIVTLSLTAIFIKFYGNLSKQNAKKMSIKESSKIVCMGVALLLIIQIVLGIIYKKIGLDDNIFDSINIIPKGGFFAIFLYIIGIALVPAIFEELLFRKVILNYSKIYGNMFAILFSSLLFAIYHMNLNQAIFAFLIGLLFGVIAVKTNSIKLTMILHFINNSYACIVTILNEESLAFILLNIIIFIFSIVGVILIIMNVPKLKNIDKNNFKINKECLLIFKNYTFIIAVLLNIIMFVVTERLINL